MRKGCRTKYIHIKCHNWLVAYIFFVFQMFRQLSNAAAQVEAHFKPLCHAKAAAGCFAYTCTFVLAKQDNLLVEHSLFSCVQGKSLSCPCAVGAAGNVALSAESASSSWRSSSPPAAFRAAADTSPAPPVASTGKVMLPPAPPPAAFPLALVRVLAGPLPAPPRMAVEAAPISYPSLDAIASHRVCSQKPVPFNTAILSKSLLDSCEAFAQQARFLLFLSLGVTSCLPLCLARCPSCELLQSNHPSLSAGGCCDADFLVSPAALLAPLPQAVASRHPFAHALVHLWQFPPTSFVYGCGNFLFEAAHCTW